MESNRLGWRVAGVLVCALVLLSFCALAAFAENDMCRVDVTVIYTDAQGVETYYPNGMDGVTFIVKVNNCEVTAGVSDWSGQVAVGDCVDLWCVDVSIENCYADSNEYHLENIQDTEVIYIRVYEQVSLTVTPAIEEGLPDNGTAGDYTYDVYVNGSLYFPDNQGGNDFYIQQGDAFEIRNIRTPACNGTILYTMPDSYHVSGTAPTNTEVSLPLPPLVDEVDVNVVIDESREYKSVINEEIDEEFCECTFDVLLNGTKISDDVHDFDDRLPYGFTVTVNNVNVQGGCLTPRVSDIVSPIDTVERTYIWLGLVSHHWSEAAATPGENGNDGEIVYTCSVCGEQRSFEFADHGASFCAVVGDSRNDVFYAMANESGGLALEEFPGGDAARWRFERLENGAYRIVSEEDGLALTVLPTVTDGHRGFDLGLAEPDDSLAQAFYLSRSDYDVYYYQFVSALSPDTVFDYGVYNDDLADYLTLGGGDGWWELRLIEDLGDEFRGELRFANEKNKAAFANDDNVELADFDGGAAQRWYFRKQSNGAYRITSEESGLALTAEPLAPEEELWRNAGLEEVADSDDQLWYIFRQPGSSPVKYYLQPVSSGLVLDLANGETENGTTIGLWDLHGGYQEQWNIVRFADLGESSDYSVVNAEVGKPIRNENGNLEQGDWSDETLWLFTKLENGAYKVSDADGTYCWTLEGDDDSGYNVVVSAYTGAETQQWFFFEDYYNGYYSDEQPGCLFARAVCSVKVLDLLNCDVETGMNVQAYEMHGGGAEQWLLLQRETRSDFYAEIFVNESDRALTNDPDEYAVAFGSYTGEDDQLWYFEHLQNGNYRIRSGQFGDYLTREDYLVVLNAADGEEEQEWTVLRGHDGAYYIRTANGPFAYRYYWVMGIRDTSDLEEHRFTFKTYVPLQSVTLSYASVTYNGKVRTPTLTVKDINGDTVGKDVGYTVAVPSGRKNAGTYTYTVTGTGAYRGSVTANLVIKKQALNVSRVTFSPASGTYNGEAITPTVTVKSAEGATLAEGTNYTMTVPSGRTEVGDYTYSITGKGNFSGTVKPVFTIAPQPLDGANVTLSWTSVAYNGAVQQPAVTVKNAAGEVLTANVDYTLAYSNEGNKAPGDYVVTVTGTGGYSGEIQKTYTVTKQSLSASRVTLSWSSKPYNGAVQKPTVTVKSASGGKLTEGGSYTVTYSADSKVPGAYTVTVKGKGYYSGTVSKNYTITNQPLDDARVTLSWTEASYNGAVQKPAVTVKNANGNAMTEGSSYTVAYSADSKIPGSYTVTVTAKGYYTGSVTKSYTIAKQPLDSSRMTLSAVSFVYNGEAQRPAVTVKNANGYAMTAGSSYTLGWSGDGVLPGQYTVTATGKGYYTGTASQTYVVVPARVTNLKATVVTADKATLKWDAVPGAQKYMVYYSATKDGTYTSYGSTANLTYTVSKAGAGSMYFKVRAFITLDGVKNYGPASAAARALPGAVKNLQAVKMTADKATLTWDAVPGAEKYMIYYSTTADGTFTSYGSTALLTYTVSKAGAGKMYFKVRAFITEDDAKVYGASAAAVRALPGQAANLQAVKVTADKATLTWDAAPGAEKYMIYYSTSENGTYTSYGSTANLTYTVSKAGAGSMYYKVRAFVTEDGAKVYGPYSAVAQAK